MFDTVRPARSRRPASRSAAPPSSHRKRRRPTPLQLDILEERVVLSFTQPELPFYAVPSFGIGAKATGGFAPRVNPALTDLEARYESLLATVVRDATPAGPQSPSSIDTRQTDPANHKSNSNMLAPLYQATNTVLPPAGDPAWQLRRDFMIHNGSVVIDAVATGAAAELQSQLVAIGMDVTGTYGSMVSGWLPITAIDRLAGLSALRIANPFYRPMTSAGSVQNQGDIAMRSNVARGVNNLNGAGITVGILSDSFDSFGTGYPLDIATGDLPPGVLVLSDYPFGADEGRAMAQLVHDVAPGSGLAFHTAFNGLASFANNILDLAKNGSDVIVDDITYFAEPMFSDGLIAQAVNTVVANGVSYFSSAGNLARQSYQSAYRNSGVNLVTDGFNWGPMMDFDPGPGVDTFQQITLGPYEGFRFLFQWDQPFASQSTSGAGAITDLDILVLDATGTTVLSGSAFDNINGDPLEDFTFFNFSESTATFQIAITKWTGPDVGYVRYVWLQTPDFTINEFYGGQTGASWGHNATVTGAGVGAAAWFETPAFGVAPPILEPFSSQGGGLLTLDAAGNPLPMPIVTGPRFVGPDGTSTSVPGFEFFFGTSAAAPNAAAVAALMLQGNPGLSPGQVFTALSASAINMGPPGFDLASGAGFIQADSAVAATRTTAISGQVVQDINNNGAQDLGEPTLSGITVYIDLDNSGTLTGGDIVRMTDVYGRYAFTGLAAGNYAVRILMPPGFIQVNPVGAFAVNLAPNQVFVGNFFISNSTYLSGNVFQDFDGDGGPRQPGDPAFAGVPVYIDTDNNGKFGSGYYRSTNVGIPVPPFGTGGSGNPANDITVSTLTISGAGIISSLAVTLSVKHTWVSDLVVTLEGPNGVVITLSAFNGGSGDDYLGTVFTDAAPISITQGSPPFTGLFQPEQPLSTFNGISADGTWTLRIQDFFFFDGGTLVSWGIAVNPEPFTLTDANGNYSLSNLPPGPIVIGADTPPGFVPSNPPGGTQNVILASGAASTANFSFRRANAIAGVVYDDINLNGSLNPGEPGLSGIPVYVDLNNNGMFDTSLAVASYAGPGIPFGGALGTPSLINVPLPISGLSGTVFNVTVTININHDWLNDVTVQLISPSGTTITLVSFIPFIVGSFTNTTFTDGAAVPIQSGTPPFTGDYRPEQPLSTFLGEDPNGTWTLRVFDTFVSADDGVFNSATLNVTAGEPVSITNSQGQFEFLGLTPNTYGFGVILPAGFFPTAPDPAYATKILAPGALATQNFGLRQGATIQGNVFDDINNNGSRDPGEPGLPGVVVFVDLNGNGVFEPTSDYNYAGAPAAVAPFGTTVFLINVAGQPAITDVNLALTILFNNPDFYGPRVTLISPSGTTLQLLPEGAPGPGFIDTILDDEAPSIIFAGSPPYSGPYRPQNPLSFFDGEDPNGTWQVVVTDVYGAGSTGVSFALQFPFERGTTTDAQGNYQFAGLPLGDQRVIALPPTGYIATPAAYDLNLAAGDTLVGNFAMHDAVAPTIAGIFAQYGINSANLLTLNRTLPWSTINTFDIVFSEDVIADPADFSLVGTKTGVVPTTFSYNPATFTVTLRLLPGRNLGADVYTLKIDGQSPNGVHDGHKTIAGNFLGDQTKTLRVLPGDFDGNGVVNALDFNSIRALAIRAMYNVFADIDGDGDVDLNDADFTRKKIGTRL